MSTRLLPRMESILFMSVMSFLFGCKSAALTGPDFNQATPRVLHLRPVSTVEYEMPGNMSNMLNYSARYADEATTTVDINLTESFDVRQAQWRSSKNLDGGIWDYNLKGRATLDLNIELVPYEANIGLIEAVQSSYDKYLNGEEGLNTALRADEPSTTDEEFGDAIQKVPHQFETVSLGTGKSITWMEGPEQRGEKTHYYAIDLKESGHYLLFAFHYSISTNSTKEAQVARTKISEDISTFMSRVRVSALNY